MKQHMYMYMLYIYMDMYGASGGLGKSRRRGRDSRRSTRTPHVFATRARCERQVPWRRATAAASFITNHLLTPSFPNALWHADQKRNTEMPPPTPSLLDYSEAILKLWGDKDEEATKTWMGESPTMHAILEPNASRDVSSGSIHIKVVLWPFAQMKRLLTLRRAAR